VPGLGVPVSPALICRTDVEVSDFERAVSMINVDGVWKTTRKSRQQLTDGLILEYANTLGSASLLEIGASCGIASLELLEQVGTACSRFFLTDRYLAIPYKRVGAVTYLYHPGDKRCIMAIGPFWIAYEDCAGCLPGLGALAGELLAKCPALNDPGGCGLASLVHPTVRERACTDKRVSLLEHDMWRPWSFGEVDAVKIANVLNKAYFGAERLRAALRNVVACAKIGGRVFLADNRTEERVTVLDRIGIDCVRIAKVLNGGAEVIGAATQASNVPGEVVSL